MKKYLGIEIHEVDPPFLSQLGKVLLSEGYLKDSETIPEAFARAATAYCYGDYQLAQRIYTAVYNNHFMFATPVLSNAPVVSWCDGKQHIIKASNGLPISCYAQDIPDTIEGQISAMQELATLSVSGGGVGLHNSIRATSKKAPGPIPYMKVLDSTIGYYKQSGNRRGAVAMYMDVSHPDIVEHIRFRQPGGDTARRTDNRKQFHHAVNLTDGFIKAVVENTTFDLVCPSKNIVYETVNARSLWEEIMESRFLTGEPFLLKIDSANEKLPETQKQLGLKIKGSNLCSEIVLPTDDIRTFVCCLSSLNIEKYDEWKDTTLVADLVRYLDNVVEWFIDNCPEGMSKAKYSAKSERALGIGSFGLAAYLQKKGIAFESGGFNSSTQLNNIIYKRIKEDAVKASRQIAVEKGEPMDMLGTGLRNSRLLAIAPNASSASIANTSPSIEPWYRNCFVQETRVGAYEVRNHNLEVLLEQIGQNTDEVWQSIRDNNGSVQHLEFLDEEQKKIYRTAMEMDQHWLVELADIRGKYICQAQSLNLFFPSGSERKYVNSVHLKYLSSENVLTLYYLRTEKEGKIAKASEVQRQALVDWSGGECKSCEG